MRIAYRAIDSQGQSVNNVIEANSPNEALERLRGEGMFVTEIHETAARAIRRPRQKAPSGTPVRVKQSELLFFTRQMAMLLRAGSPIVPAMSAIGKQMSGAGREVIEMVRADMEKGKTISDSMSRFPTVFSQTYTAIIAAGEQSANLEVMFTRLGNLLVERRQVRNRTIAALAYPALLSMLSVSIVVTMVLFVVPRFSGLFSSLGAELPWSTKLMMSTSGFVRENWIVTLAGAAGLITGAVVVFRSHACKQWISDMQTRLPIAGRLFKRLIQAQMFRVMGLLLESRVNMMEMLQLSRNITSNKDFLGLCDGMQDAVENGNRLSDAVIQSGLVSPTFAQAIRTGEESGNLDQALLFIADVLEEENGQLIATMTKLLEPTILILMGGLVGGIAMSLFLPLFDLAAAGS